MASRTKNTNSARAKLAPAASAALKALAALEKSLPLDTVSAKALLKARAANRVPNEAVAIAAEIFAKAPQRFAPFDGAEVEDGLAYQELMAPVARELTRLARRINDTIIARRARAVKLTLTVYRYAKEIPNENPKWDVSVEQRRLAAHLSTVRKDRATAVTKAEARGAVGELRAEKTAAAKRGKAAKAASAAGGAFAPGKTKLTS